MCLLTILNFVAFYFDFDLSLLIQRKRKNASY